MRKRFMAGFPHAKTVDPRNSRSRRWGRARPRGASRRRAGATSRKSVARWKRHRHRQWGGLLPKYGRREKVTLAGRRHQPFGQPNTTLRTFPVFASYSNILGYLVLAGGEEKTGNHGQICY